MKKTIFSHEKESQNIIVYLLVKDTCSLGPLGKNEKQKKRRFRFMVKKEILIVYHSEGARRLTGLDSIDSTNRLVSNLPGTHTML